MELVTPAPTSRRRYLRAACAVLVLGLAVTGLGANALNQADGQRAAAEFAERSSLRATAIQQRLDAYFARLRTIGAFLGSGAPLSQAELAQMVATDNSKAELASLQSIFFVARVHKDQADALIQRAGGTYVSMGDPPAGAPDADHRYVLTHNIPIASDYEMITGFEISGLATMRALLIDAAESGGATIGAAQRDPALIKVLRAADNPSLLGLLDVEFFIGLPVFDTSGNRGVEHLTGWVGAPVARFDEVLESAAGGLPPDTGIALTVDVQNEAESFQAMSKVTATAGAARPEGAVANQHRSTFESFGVDFTLETWTVAPPAGPPAEVVFMLAGGMLASLLAAGVVYLRVAARDRARALADEVAGRSQFRRDVVDSVTDAMVVVDAAGAMVAANQAWLTMAGDEGTGFAPLAGGGRYIDELALSSDPHQESLAAGLHAVLAGTEDLVEVDLPVGDRWFSARVTPLRGSAGGAVIIHTDITERRASADQLRHEAERDNLTQLLNRGAVRRAVDGALEPGPTGVVRPFAVLFVDLDGFKEINDQHGHLVGDEVLREVSRRLGHAVRPSDSVGRLGGDEFVVVLRGCDRQGAARCSARILEEMRRPFMIDGTALAIGASIGADLVAPHHAEATTALAVIDRADRAMYAAKRAGGHGMTFADEAADLASDRR